MLQIMDADLNVCMGSILSVHLLFDLYGEWDTEHFITFMPQTFKQVKYHIAFYFIKGLKVS